MEISGEKIVEITEAELMSRYLEREMDDAMTFQEYRYRFEAAGCVVLQGGENNR